LAVEIMFSQTEEEEQNSPRSDVSRGTAASVMSLGQTCYMIQQDPSGKHFMYEAGNSGAGGHYLKDNPANDYCIGVCDNTGKSYVSSEALQYIRFET
jgi:hypothetical protein